MEFVKECFCNGRYIVKYIVKLVFNSKLYRDAPCISKIKIRWNKNISINISVYRNRQYENLGADLQQQIRKSWWRKAYFRNELAKPAVIAPFIGHSKEDFMDSLYKVQHANAIMPQRYTSESIAALLYSRMPFQTESS